MASRCGVLMRGRARADEQRLQEDCFFIFLVQYNTLNQSSVLHLCCQRLKATQQLLVVGKISFGKTAEFNKRKMCNLYILLSLFIFVNNIVVVL